VFDLDRFLLYQALHVELPHNSEAERSLNAHRVVPLLRGHESPLTHFAHPPDSSLEITTHERRI
jgi:hypothetical protein